MVDLPLMLTTRTLMRLVNLGVPKGAPWRIDRKGLRRMLIRQGVLQARESRSHFGLWDIERAWPELADALRDRVAQERARGERLIQD